MPARRKVTEPQTPPTTPQTTQKTRSKRNGSGSSFGSSVGSTGSQRFTAYLKERPSASSSIYSPEENPFSREDEIFGQIKLANSQSTINNLEEIDDDDSKNQFVPLPTMTTDRGIVNSQNNNINHPGLLKRGLNFLIGLLAKSLNLIGFTIFLLFWCIKKSIDFVWNNLNGPFSNSITTSPTPTPTSIPIPTTATTTTTINVNNKRNKWLTYLLLFAIIILLLLLLLSNGDNNKRRLIDYFPSHSTLQIWPFSDTTYKIQPIEKVDDVSTGNDRNDSITFTVEDFRNMIIAEVNDHLKSEDQKRLPSPIDQNEFVRNIVVDEIKNILTKKFNYRPDSSRLHRSLRGEEMLEIIRKEASLVVKAELLKYSQDKLNKPDFALHSGGAKVISKFTSKTYELWPDKWYQKTFAYLSGQGILRGKPPVTAIKHDTNVGECWPFPGQEGQLAVLLNRRVYVTAVTYDHVSKDIAVDIYSAPKEFEVWGIIDDGTGGRTNKDDDEDLDLDRTYDMESTEELCGPREDGEYVPGKNNNLPNNANSENDNSGSGGLSYWNPPLENLTKDELNLGSSPYHLFLGRYIYNIDGLPVQTFEIPQNILKYNKPIRAIIMRVNSNWGKPDYTCLYRFRVHGEPA